MRLDNMCREIYFFLQIVLEVVQRDVHDDTKISGETPFMYSRIIRGLSIFAGVYVRNSGGGGNMKFFQLARFMNTT